MATRSFELWSALAAFAGLCVGTYFLHLQCKRKAGRMFRIVKIALAAALLGAFSNTLAMIANGGIMPVSMGGEGRLWWLTDWISPAGWIYFLFPDHTWWISPGDLLLSAAFLLLWWFILALFCAPAARLLRQWLMRLNLFY